ncbi:hypothetical protein K493DRAFT_254579 [Basidiobolus meristosporus CBS 931.73]|uniref:Eukaryotic translation initiation factor 5B n=1 Tax=Basidiobolus meristosporus CBS 931.73 TaxID=1314790 RepID=A0A1Y1YY05_9FUNG|nr:hypothetical protein K493DRAFT_254579 [Basidiobolus meristosporus CBS 931.73]|eukprot:ORY02913.1 hypothetical protein K493DRAFT_254579 [Basidiobolus meristosporus CBS 931.73]
MAKKKGGNKKKQDDYWDNEFEEDAQALNPDAPAEEGQDANGEDDSVGGGLMSQISRANKKNKKNKKAAEVETPEVPMDIEIPEEPVIVIKSKKEKEREKKEKQKEAKKKKAQEKKAQNASKPAEEQKPVETPVESPVQEVAEATPQDSDDEEAEGESKSAKDKKKKKKKKKAAEEEKPKKKKGGPNIAALQKMLEAQRLAEEEERLKEEEEKRKLEEERKRIEEEERAAEEAKRKKKEKEKAKREQLKKEGKLLSKKEKEAKRLAELRLQQMLDSGVIVQGIAEQQENDNKPKKVVYGKRKKNNNQKKEPVEKKPEPVKPKVEAKPEPEEEVEAKESWEMSSEDEKPQEEEVKESWEMSSEDEKEEATKDNWDDSSEDEEKPEAKAPAPAEPKAEPKPTPKPAAKPATKSESDESEESDGSEDDSEEDSDEDSSDYDSEDDSDEELTTAQKQALQRKQEAAERRHKRHEEAMAARSKDDLRSPICCILGHVDTGKTKLLDKIRQTNVQEGEAGGITQQIGATYFPMDAIKQKTAVLKSDMEYKLPGLLVIDTPGHESFTNLRSRGSSLCNIAVLVVDIMHGLEPQTLESLRLLRDKKTPFVVALNKIDRIYGWEQIPNNSFRDSYEKQNANVKREFENRVTKTITEFAEQGLNACLYFDNKNLGRNVSLIPTSAITGEGIPDLLNLLVHLTQTRMSDKLMYLSELECTVLEVKVIEGLGTTIDVVLSNGVLNEGDRIVVCGLNGPIVTTVRALLTPQPLRELRVKSAYVHHKSVKAALGIKISAQDLDKAIAGSRLLVVGPDDDEEDLMDEVMSDLQNLQSYIDTTGRGVCVQASTLGSLEALLEFLRTSNIPVSGINIGPVHKKDIIRASVMLEKAKEFAVMLCFDVKVDKDAQDLADEFGVKVFKADIIYHLFDQFTAYNQEIVEQKRKDQAPQAVFPCVLKIIPGCVFNKRDPLILGVDVVEGVLRSGTPICVVRPDPVTGKKEITTLGRVTSMEQNHKSVDQVKKGQAGGGIAIKIECAVYETPKTFGRHFVESDELYSRITRGSIDILKESFRNDLSKEEWALVVKLKKTLDIQ